MELKLLELCREIESLTPKLVFTDGQLPDERLLLVRMPFLGSRVDLTSVFLPCKQLAESSKSLGLGNPFCLTPDVRSVRSFRQHKPDTPPTSTDEFKLDPVAPIRNSSETSV